MYRWECTSYTEIYDMPNFGLSQKYEASLDIVGPISIIDHKGAINLISVLIVSFLYPFPLVVGICLCVCNSNIHCAVSVRLKNIWDIQPWKHSIVLSIGRKRAKSSVFRTFRARRIIRYFF